VTGSGPCSLAQQGTLPFSYWKGANQSMKSRTSGACPMRSSAEDVSAPSRIHERS
jgi:hypothetical protein